MSAAVSPVSACQFAVFRIALGIYLFIHFAGLIPYAGELFGSSGMLPDPSANMTYGVFPDLLFISGSDAFLSIYLATLSILALLFASGCARRVVSVALWYGWASLYHRNNLISSPHLPFIGWLLLACALIPSGEPWSIYPRQSRGGSAAWALPKELYLGAWAILAVGYSMSGLDKALHSPSWQNGQALALVLKTPLSRGNLLCEIFAELPVVLRHLMTWAVLACEVFFAPLSVLKRTRPWVWGAMLGMQLGILTTISFGDLTIGMLLAQAFVFDGRWLKSSKLA